LDFLDDLIAIYGEEALWISAIFSFYFGGLFLSGSLERRRRWLESYPWENWYLRLLNNVLTAITHFFDDTPYPPSPGRSSTTLSHPFTHNPWTARSYDRCLLLAFLYPLFGVLCFWIVYGDEGKIGTWIILPETEWYWRLLIASLIAFIIIISWTIKRSRYSVRFISPIIVFISVTGVISIIAGAEYIASNSTCICDDATFEKVMTFGRESSINFFSAITYTFLLTTLIARAAGTTIPVSYEFSAQAPSLTVCPPW